MIELPEVHVLAEQINQTLEGKTIKNVTANANPHSFAWFSGDPAAYNGMLSGKKITKANVDIYNESVLEIICDDMLLNITTPIKYHAPGGKLPKSHQLLLEFADGSHMSCTVQMWGGMLCTPLADKGVKDTSWYFVNPDAVANYKENEEIKNRLLPSPLSDAFDKAYWNSLIDSVKQNMSAKAFLATEQRIPGLGNGVLQDILWNAKIHPKRKLETMTNEDKERLFSCVKSTLKEMKDKGGRDTEKDLYGQKGGYNTVLSKNTLLSPCPACGSNLVRQAYMGGNIYFCPGCQPVP
ncbi:MAG: endonuclease VIII [Defluviitaleaceae bacterium]|nr:endonuclease VIII [Defluviitaleaceae bacterium]